MARKTRAAKKTSIMKDKTVSSKKAAAMRKKPGGSNVGDYSEVSKGDFAGVSGGAAEGSYPINTRKRAKSAIKLAHNAPNPAGIRKAVDTKYPSLTKKSDKSK